MVSIPKTMKAAVVEEFGKPIAVKEIPVPEPGYGQVLIKVITSGVCHTDLHVREGDWIVKPQLPIIPGHEGAGIVVKLGKGVTNVAIGDRVGHAWLHDSCGGCDYCLSGWETVCGHQNQTGFGSNGCFAEYTVAEASYVGRIPDSLSFSQAAPILCAGVTTYKALKETEAKAGQWVAILGACGGLGHVGCQYAAAMGLKVCAVDFGADKQEYALTVLGCDAFVDVKGKTQDQIVAAVKAACDGVGAHGSVILAPRPDSYQQGVDMLRPMGCAVGIALPPGDFPVDIFTMILHRKTIRGSIVGTRKDLNDCLKIAGDGKVVCTVAERKLEEINDVLNEMEQGKIKGRCVLRICPDESLVPATMKAAVVEQFGKPIVVKTIPTPKPGRGQVLIKVIASGVCHTDLHVREGDWIVKPQLPIIPGHEGAGIIVALGAGVTSLAIGDRVGHAWLHDSCGGCDYCLSGWETVCGRQNQTGFGSNGCFAEYTVAEASYVGRIPDTLSFSQAAPILCAGVTTYKALKETEAKAGQWVAILGACGGLGHVGCQYAAAMGLKVCAVDFGADKKDYALNVLGCDAFVDVKGRSAEQIVAAVKEACDGVGAHGSVILAPRPDSYQQGVDMLRPMGCAVGIALPPGAFPVDIFTMILHRKTIRGSIVGTRKDLNDCLKIAGDGKVRCTVQERPLEDINDILNEMEQGKIKGRCVLRVAPEY